MTLQEIADRNRLIVHWYVNEQMPMRRIVAKTRLTYRQIYRVLGGRNVKPRGWQDVRKKSNCHV